MSFFFKLGFVVASAVAVGCSGGVSLGNVPSALNPDDGGAGRAGADGNPGGASGPYDITCTMYFQPATSKLEESFTVRSDADASKTISFPGYTIDAAFAHPASAGEGILTVSVREQKTSQRFPVSTEQSPSRDFAGDHGFTGLVYVGADVQYICKAPPAPVAAPSTKVAPFHVRCTSELKSTTTGVVEKSESFDLTAADTRTLELGDFGVRARFSDDAFDGRSMLLDAWRKPATADTHTIRQLFQLDRSLPIVNHLPGGTFTGRTVLGGDADREVSYSCTAL